MQTLEQHYSLSALARLTGLGRKVLEYWKRKEYLIPSAKAETRKFYTLEDFETARKLSVEVHDKPEKIKQRRQIKTKKLTIDDVLKECTK